MHCPKCGALNADSAAQCNLCGASFRPEPRPVQVPPPAAYPPLQPYQQPYQPTYPPYPQYVGPVQAPNLLVPAILITVLCCWPLGIPAIIYAAQANSKAAAGDYYGAMNAASSAKTWCWVAGVLGFIGGILIFLIQISSVLGHMPTPPGRY